MKSFLINDRYEIIKPIREGFTKLYLAKDMVSSEEVFLQIYAPAEIGVLTSDQLHEYLQAIFAKQQPGHYPFILTVLDCEMVAVSRACHTSRFTWRDKKVAGSAAQAALPEGACYCVFKRASGSMLSPTALADKNALLPLLLNLLEQLHQLHLDGWIHYGLALDTVFLEPEKGVLEMIGPQLSGPWWWQDLSATACAPELKLKQPHDHRVDLYAVGVMFYQLLTGRPPFSGSVQQMWQQQQRGVELPAKIRSAFPAFSACISRLLAWDATQRYRDAAAAAQALQETDKSVGQRYSQHPAVIPAFSDAHDLLPQLRDQCQRLTGKTQPDIHFCLVAGNPGQGKTRLLQEVMLFCQLQQLAVFYHNCQASCFPLQPLFSLLGNIHHGLAPDQPLPDFLQSASRAANSSAANESPQLSASAARVRTQELLLQALATYTQDHPLVLLWDDLELASPETRDCLRCLLTHTTMAGLPLLVIATYNRQAQESILASFRGEDVPWEANTLQLELPSLPAEHIRACYPVPSRGSSGPAIPLYLLRALQTASGGQNQSAMLKKQWERLAKVPQRLLHLLQLSDQPLKLVVLAAAAGQTVGATLLHLQDLAQAGWIRWQAQRNGLPSMLASQQEFIPPVPPAKGASLAHRLAQALESQDGHPCRAYLLAHLFLQGQQLPKAAQYLQAAIALSLELGLYQQAVKLGSALLPLHQHTSWDQSRLLAMQGEILLAAAESQEAMAQFQKAHKESPSEVFYLLRAAEIALQRNELGWASKALDKARQWVRTKIHLQAYHLFLQGVLKARQGNPERGSALIQEGLHQMEQRTDWDQAQHEDARLYCAWVTDDHFVEFNPQAASFITRALEIIRQVNHLPALALLHQKLSLLNTLQGQHETAIANMARSLEIYEKTANFQAIADALVYMAGYHLNVGQYRKASGFLDQAQKFAREHQLGLLWASCQLVRGRLAFLRGQLQQSHTLLLQALEGLRSENGVLLCMTLCELVKGSLDEPERAQEYYQQAHEIALRLGYPRLLILTALSKARLAESAVFDMQEVLPAMQRALQLADAHAYHAFVWQIYYRRGNLYRRQGALRQALADFQKAREHLAQLARHFSPEIRASFMSVPGHRAVQKMLTQIAAEMDNDLDRSGVHSFESATAGEGSGANAPASSGHGQLFKLRRLRHENRELRKLLELNKKINSERDLDNLLQLIMDTAVELTNAERGFLIFLKGSRMNFEVARDFEREAVKRPEFEISHTIAEEVMKSGQAILTTNAAGDERFDGYRSVSALKLHSVLCVPLRVRENIIGALYIDNRSEKAVFAERDKALLEAFADQAAIAIENARLMAANLEKQEKLQQSKERIEKLNRELESLNQQLARKLENQSKELKEVRAILTHKYNYQNIIGRSPKMQELFTLLDKLTDSTVPVYIYGESGTGKELVARAIHFNGPRRHCNFMSENCAALSDSLLESELFGHVKGAFTNAHRDKQGLFELAHGGTLFLDEVGDMSPEMQKKLLRVLQEKEIRRVGGKEMIPVDVRIISASNKNLKELIAAGKFREDLFYRLNVVCLELPPLRQRTEDIPLLVEHFLEEFAKEMGVRKKVRKNVHKLLCAYNWPGNIRELRNILYSVVSLSDKEILDEEDFKERLPQNPIRQPGNLFAEQLSIDEYVQRFILTWQTKYNDSQIAKILGISRKTLWEKRKKWNLSR